MGNSELKIKVEKPSKDMLDSMKVKTWPIWTKEASAFDWSYDEREVCYFLEGEVTVETAAGPVSIHKGDLATFPKGLKCKWIIKQSVRKHYQFG